MVRAEIRGLIRNSLPRLDKTNRWHDMYIDGAIEKAIANLYEDIWKINPLNLQRYTKGYGYTTPVQVATEATTGIKYSTLPESIHPFQDKASGVRRISTMAQGSFTFFPMDFREMDLIASGCYFDTVNTKIGYAVNQTRVEYYGMTTAIQTMGVRMDLIIPFSKYAETDEVKIPEITEVTGTNYQKKASTFVDRVMAILGVVQPVDLKDDNSGNKVDNKDN
jgi:hypothetical protein